MPYPSIPDAGLPMPAGAVFVLIALLLYAAIPAGGASTAGVFSVREQGAVGDGKVLDTDAINRAILACSTAGGGQVLFPSGRYLSGTVRLKSNVTLKLEAGATLVGTSDLDRYEHFPPPEDAPEARFDPHWHRALLLGIGVKNVAIVGPGTIDGAKVFDPRGEERMRGPHTILLGLSDGIEIRDVSIRDSANYAVMLEGCDRVQIRGIRVTGGWDGVHFRGWKGRPCRQVSILDSQFYTGDDSIAGRYWEDTLISRCVLNSSCNAIRLIGPATRLIIHDSLMYGPGLYEHRTSNRTNMLAGVNLQPGAWDPTEGDLDDILISGVTMKNVTTPLHISLKPGNRAGRITVSNLSATGVYRAACSVESWAEEPIRRMVLRDVSVEYAGGGTKEQAGAEVKAPGVDARSLPAWGLYARNVGQLFLENVRLFLEDSDERPALIADRVESLTMDGLRLPKTVSGIEPIRLIEVSQIRGRDSSPEWRTEGEEKPASPKKRD